MRGFLALVLSALLLAACDGSSMIPRADPTEGSLRTHFDNLADGEASWQFHGWVQNDTQKVLLDVSCTFEFLDAAGATIRSVEFDVGSLQPGQRVSLDDQLPWVDETSDSELLDCSTPTGSLL